MIPQLGGSVGVEGCILNLCITIVACIFFKTPASSPGNSFSQGRKNLYGRLLHYPPATVCWSSLGISIQLAQLRVPTARHASSIVFRISPCLAGSLLSHIPK